MKYIAFICAAVVSWTVSAAEPSAAARQEIDQLLGRLAASGCTFQRNGKWHSAADARSHLEKKYRYLLDKQLVGTTEDFISLAASKSSSSGKAYLVQCGTREQVTSAAWMTTQLKEVRAKAPSSP